MLIKKLNQLGLHFSRNRLKTQNIVRNKTYFFFKYTNNSSIAGWEKYLDFSFSSNSLELFKNML